MTFLMKFIVASSLALFVSASIFAQENKPTSTKKIVPCRYKPAFKPADFRVYFSYYFDVGENGEISKITELSNFNRDKKAKFVHDELFVECMKSWQLQPAGRYFVSFTVGVLIGAKRETPRDYMRIVDPNKEVLIVGLISDDEYTKIEDTKDKP